MQRIVDAEWNLRYSKKLNRFIKKATLKYPAADLDETIYNPERQLDVHIIEELSKCEWIEQGKTLLLQGRPVLVKVISPMHFVYAPCASSRQHGT